MTHAAPTAWYDERPSYWGSRAMWVVAATAGAFFAGVDTLASATGWTPMSILVPVIALLLLGAVTTYVRDRRALLGDPVLAAAVSAGWGVVVLPPREAFDAAETALRAVRRGHVDPDVTDFAAGTLRLTTPFTWRSYGRIIDVRLSRLDESRVTISARSRSRYRGTYAFPPEDRSDLIRFFAALPIEGPYPWSWSVPGAGR